MPEAFNWGYGCRSHPIGGHAPECPSRPLGNTRRRLDCLCAGSRWRWFPVSIGTANDTGGGSPASLVQGVWSELEGDREGMELLFSVRQNGEELDLQEHLESHAYT